ncbi:MAG: fasciclin domain-containing protein [Bacteroidales bacterium]|jgi:uncharacterized surface protein with fasciclin (FAS1) repeats|nr:fasciclin domain-containing protein [Bacteroidales bacterium]
MMKKNIIDFRKLHMIKMLLVPLALAMVFASCEIQEDYEYVYGNPGGKVDMTAWEYIQSNDSLSLMEEAITATGLQSLYSGTTVRTFIAPRNTAFRAYMKTNSYANISAIPVATLESVLKYHIVNAKVIFTDPDLLLSNNPISYPTESGSVMYLSHNTNYQGVINQGTKKSWTIITSNIEPTNGVIHVTADVVYLSL